MWPCMIGFIYTQNLTIICTSNFNNLLAYHVTFATSAANNWESNKTWLDYTAGKISETMQMCVF